jgi:hypothetical protein
VASVDDQIVQVVALAIARKGLVEPAARIEPMPSASHNSGVNWRSARRRARRELVGRLATTFQLEVNVEV